MKQIVLLLLIVLQLCACAPASQPESSKLPNITPSFTHPTVPTAEFPPEPMPDFTENQTLPPVIPPTVPPAILPTDPQPQSPTVPPTEHPTEPVLPSDPLKHILQSMTIEEKVGQLFLARCPDKNALQDIQKYHLGGYVLFGRDFAGESKESLRRKLSDYQSASRIPMLIAVDEEGGRVVRVSKYPSFRSEPFPSARMLYSAGGLEALKKNEHERSYLLHSLGINVNIAPVCDITTNPLAFMYDRSLGQSPEITGQFVSSVLPIMHQYCVSGVLKHFPGYGNNTDTHVAIARDERPLSQLESCDLVPFQRGIDSGCSAIMVSHVYINAIDPDTPATLSPAVHRYLREKMNFRGVIITDDLVMKAITDVYGVGESAVLAVLAGNDVLCATDYPQQYEAVLAAVTGGRIPLDRLNESVMRILKWKQTIHLI